MDEGLRNSTKSYREILRLLHYSRYVMLLLLSFSGAPGRRFGKLSIKGLRKPPKFDKMLVRHL